MANRILALISASCCLAAAAQASASTLVARDAKDVRLEVNAKGQALVTYRTGGKTWHVLAWGAVGDEVTMRVDYAGGYGAFGRPVWKTFRDASSRYDGPQLAWLVRAVKAPDGSYWALQAWQRGLPNQGATPSSSAAGAWELRLSHWRGELPRLEVWVDWVMRGRYRHLFGRLTYQGRPVYGYQNTPSGRPLDKYSRNVYVDTLNSAYGSGWKRESSFLTHRPRGNFCYGFYPRGKTPGVGERYRITVIGPGAAPDASWEGADPGPYDAARDAELNAIGSEVAGDDPRCQKA
jgi:hypothetical protein